MALTSRRAGIYPEIPATIGGIASMLLDASGEQVAFIFIVPKTGNLSIIHFRLGAVTTGQGLTVSLQDVSPTTGDPDGTVDQSGTVTVADTDDNTWKSATMGTVRAVTQGDRLAAVIGWTGTVGNLNIARGSQSDNSLVYSDLFTAAWAKSAGEPIVVLEYDDGSFAWASSTLAGLPTVVDFNNGSSPSEHAAKFQFPFPVKVMGIKFRGRLSGDADLVLYDSADPPGAALESVSLDTNMIGVAGTADVLHGGMFDTIVTLNANTVYYASIKPTTTTNIRATYVEASVAAWLDQMPGGQNFHGATRAGAGWTAITTRRYNIGLIVDSFDDGAGVISISTNTTVIRAMPVGVGY